MSELVEKLRDGFMVMLAEAREDGTCIVDGTDYAGIAHDRLTEAADRIEELEAKNDELRFIARCWRWGAGSKVTTPVDDPARGRPQSE